MDNIVKKLFEAGLLSEDDTKSLQEGFDARVNEATATLRESLEVQIREEMAQRFEHDKASLVEAMDRMLTDVVQKVEEQRASELAQLREAKAKYESALVETRQAYKVRAREHAKTLESFVMSTLKNELTAFNEDRNAVAGMRIKLAQQIAEGKDMYKARLKEHMALMRSFVIEKLSEELKQVKEQADLMAVERAQQMVESEENKKALQEAFAHRIQKLDEYVVRQMSKELREFHEDKRALQNKRVQLVTESRKKLAETQREFVAKAAKMVDRQVTETLHAEMKQLHEDLEANRQNMFGRRIFEAVAAEFMTSYYSEGTEVKALGKIVESSKAKMAALQTKLAESQVQIEQATRKAKLAEEKANRTAIMAELTGNLSREKKAVMEELLETVKTTQLRESFNKYLPAVLNEKDSKKTQAPQRSRVLAETTQPVRQVIKESTVAITGDQRTNRLKESVKAEVLESEKVSEDTATILRLAGLKK